MYYNFNKSLHITINNSIYTLTPIGTTIATTPHRLHMFLNSHNRMSYLRHTHNVDEHTSHRLEIPTPLYTLPIQATKPSTNDVHYNTCPRLSNDSKFPYGLTLPSALDYDSCHSHDPLCPLSQTNTAIMKHLPIAQLALPYSTLDPYYHHPHAIP